MNDNTPAWRLRDDGNNGRRAASGLLAQQLPAHGRHAGPSAHSAPHDAAGPGSFVIPSRAVPTPEKNSPVYEAVRADATLNPRKGRVQAAEGLAQRDPNIEAAFGQSFTSSRSASSQTYEVQPAGVRSPLGTGADSGNPAWSTDAAHNLGILRGVVESFQGQPGNVPALSERSTPHTIVDLSKVDLGRGNVTYGKTYGSDFKQLHRNEAQVQD